MARIIVFLNKLINLYLYFVIMACFLGCVPNINPNYPLFHYIFKFAGFNLIPPIFGFYISPAVVMISCALISRGLIKIYNKYYESKKPEVIVISADEFIKRANEFAQNSEELEERKDEDNE